MRRISFVSFCVLALAGSDAVLALDSKSYHAMITCLRFLRDHDARFEALPSEAIVADPHSISKTDEVYSIHWTVKWDTPETDASGTCKVQNNQLLLVE